MKLTDQRAGEEYAMRNLDHPNTPISQRFGKFERRLLPCCRRRARFDSHKDVVACVVRGAWRFNNRYTCGVLNGHFLTSKNLDCCTSALSFETYKPNTTGTEKKRDSVPPNLQSRFFLSESSLSILTDAGQLSANHASSRVATT